MRVLEVTEIKPVWRFLLETLREYGLRRKWNYILIFVKKGVRSPFGTVIIAIFKVNEDTAEVEK
jgi:hypothetical protein